MSNMYIWGQKAFWKIKFSDSFQNHAIGQPHIPNQSNPPNYNSYDVMSKNVYFWSQKRPFWKIQASDSFKNYTIGKLICQNIFLDTKIILLAIIVLKLWAKMHISSHVTKNAINRPFWIFFKLWKVVRYHMIWYYIISKYEKVSFYGLSWATWYTLRNYKLPFLVIFEKKRPFWKKRDLRQICNLV